MIDIDYAALTDPELDALVSAGVDEQQRRLTLAMAPQQVEQINRDVLNAEGLKDGDPWRQPNGAHDAYPMPFTVTHDGKLWANLTPANVWEPGVANWREVKDPDVPPLGPAEWVQPTGAGDAYNTGDKVTFEGKVYTSTMDANVWSPLAYPPAWSVDLA